ncbi:MAG: DUF134 domain-containing protein [Promethearchaeota archaeon]
MPRPRKMKFIHGPPIPENRTVFKPLGIPMRSLEVNVISIVEFEAIRLIDGEERSQIEAAELMGISQPTISRILKTGRKKIADAIIRGKAIKIEGGDYKFAFNGYGCANCNYEWKVDGQGYTAPERCPNCNSEKIFVLRKEV